MNDTQNVMDVVYQEAHMRRPGWLMVRGAGLAVLLVSMMNVGLWAASSGIQMTSEYQQAQQQMAGGSYEAAIGVLQPLLGNPQYSGAARVEIGKIRQRQAEVEMSQALGHFNEAATFFNEGIENGAIQGPEAAKVLYDLAKIYDDRLNDFPRAADMYGRVVQNHPTFLSIDKAVFGLASCQEKTGNVEEAAKWYQEIVVKYPYSSFFQTAQHRMKKLAPGTQSAKGAIEAQQGVVEGARTETQAAKATLDLAAMHASQGDYKKAIEEYRKIANDPSNPELARQAYTRMASLMDEKEKDYKGAAEALEEMVNKFPNEPGTEKNLLKLGRIYEENLQSLKTRESGDGTVLYKKSTENVRKAIEYYDKVTENYPDADVSADAYLRKGQLFEGRLKDTDEAIKQYKEYLRKFPDHEEAEKIRSKVKKLESGETDED